MPAKFLTRPTLQIVGKTQTGIFPISEFLVNPYKENCHNSRTSNDTDMKLGPATKINRKNTTTLKKIDDDVMSTYCDFIVAFPMYG